MQEIPTVSRNSPNKLVNRIWSLMPPLIKDTKELKFSTFNARMETIREKSTYKSSWEKSKRCLIPATYFVEFKKATVEGKEKKIPFKFSVKGQEIFSIAGLYEDAHPTESCTIITTEAGEQMKPIHHREPCIILKKDEDKWLSKDTPLDEAFSLLRSMYDEGFVVEERRSKGDAPNSR